MSPAITRRIPARYVAQNVHGSVRSGDRPGDRPGGRRCRGWRAAGDRRTGRPWARTDLVAGVDVSQRVGCRAPGQVGDPEVALPATTAAAFALAVLSASAPRSVRGPPCSS
ncbi:hypothetical protein GCM10027451_49090 [Geodermatophilus aquaeductus]